MILFLDFDGVLHSFGEKIANYCCYLPRLESVLRDFPEVQIVVSSDWRKHHDLEELRTFFSPDIADRVVGVTPDLSSTMNKLNHTSIRYLEAKAWQDKNQYEGPWVALDDDPLNWLENDPHLIFCDDGFADHEEQTLRQALSMGGVKNAHPIPTQLPETKSIIWETTIIDAGDGSGDGLLVLPDALSAQLDWHDGDTVLLTASDCGKLILSKCLSPIDVASAMPTARDGDNNSDGSERKEAT